MTSIDFEALGLSDPLLRGLRDLKFKTPTPIQAKTIPHALDGKDMLGIAQTGTGKTAAFVLPILQELAEDWQKPIPSRPLSIILAPTRELAIQIGQTIELLSRHLPVRHTVIFGGVNQKPQVRVLQQGVDIVVATPGRLLDLMRQKHLIIEDVWHFVLDEADRMLDMGFIHDVKRIVEKLPKDRQTLFFSATMPKTVTSLANTILDDPVRVEVTPQATPVDRIQQSVFFVSAEDKTALLTQVLQNDALEKIIVFTRTKHRANKVANLLAKSGISAEAIHGNKSQTARQKALRQFDQGDIRVLVATDIAARGIHVDRVSHVINFELPNVAEDYVHRIGRTARAGADGNAISFCDPSEQSYLQSIEKLTRHQLIVSGGTPSEPEPNNSKGRSSVTKTKRRSRSSAYKATFERQTA